MKSLAAILAAGVFGLALPASAEPLLVGVFVGVLPCADCSGIRTELTLVRKASGWAEGRFLMKETYLGRRVAPFVSTGEWTTIKGDAVDDNAVVYELNPDHPTRHFLKDGEHRIEVLDGDLKALPRGLPRVLLLQSKGAPTAAAIACLQRGGVPGGPACGRPPAVR